MVSENCPICGGYMEIDDSQTEYKNNSNEALNNPNDLEPIHEVYKCEDCGYKEIN